MATKIKHKFSLKKKTALLFLVFSIVIVVIATWIFARVIYNYTTNNFTSKLDELTKTVAGTIDVERADRFIEKAKAAYAASGGVTKYDDDGYDDYMAYFEDLTSDPDYIYLRMYLQAISDINNVDCIYLSWVNVEDRAFIYVVDSAREDPCLPGTADPIYEINEKVLEDPTVGFPPYITDTEEYGHLMTSGAPIILNGRVIGYAMSDITLEQVYTERAANVFKFFFYIIASLVLFAIVTIIVVNFGLVRPIKKLADAALDFSLKTDDPAKEGAFSKLIIKTGDEVEFLATSMKKMESELNEKVTELSRTSEELSESKQVATKMTRLANKDSLTGVRNKTAYDAKVEKLDEQIRRGEARFGIAMIDLNDLKLHNDYYGHDCGDAAIIKLCNIICATFAHSPVYRVGGDEFVVVLQNFDYDNIEKIEADFNAKLDEINRDEFIPNREKITAALGYAIYDENTDVSATEVFKRADSAMYENKCRMKGLV